jgi:hypothetical protein
MAEDKTSDKETTIGSEVGNSLKTGFRRKKKYKKKYGADVVWFFWFPGFTKCIARFGTFWALQNLSFSAQILYLHQIESYVSFFLRMCLSFSANLE